MKGKKAIIISSLILGLTLILTFVGTSAAWFGSVNSRTIADLEIGAGEASASTGVSIASGDIAGQSLIPAVAKAGYFGNAIHYPGNYFTCAEGETFNINDAVALDPSNDNANAIDPSEDLKNGILSKATSVQFVLSIRRAPSEGEGSDDIAPVKLILAGAYLEKDLTKVGSGEYSDYEKADGNGRNFKNEFNVKMSLVQNKDGEGDVLQEVVQYDNAYYANNPFGHILTVQAKSNVTYFVKFEIYFNKVDEECDPELLCAKLVLHIKLDLGAAASPTQP